MFKLISFIGTGNYKETTYQFDELKIKTRYFPVVAAAICRPGEILVVKTRAATDKHWEPLRQELKERGFPAPVPVDIPDGKSIEELWQIFNILVERVQEEDRVAFDITHSFRSLPLISFLSVAYLKFVKNINIQALYYGAYEARDEERNIAPVFDLTGFCSLLDWIVAVNSFINHGTAREVGQLLIQAQKTAKAEQGPARRELNNFGKLLEDISRALFTNRPFEVMEQTRKLNKYMEGTEERRLLERDVREWAAPFGVLMDNVIAGFSGFMGSPEQFNPASLEKHLKMARWYVEHNYAPQALSMMRELAISVVMCRKGQYKCLFDRNARESTAAELHRAGNSTLAGKLWSRLGDLRNDVIHTGWRKGGVRSSSKVMEETRECLELLEALFTREELTYPGEPQEEKVSLVKVLVTPLGMSPGLLYTALTRISPRHMLVVTSAEGKASLERIVDEAGYGGTVEVVEVGDPFAGFGESSRVMGELVSHLEKLPPFHLYVNLTGGTTLLQHMVSRLTEIDLENCREITTVAMVDRRSAEEQQRKPFVQGEMIIVE